MLATKVKLTIKLVDKTFPEFIGNATGHRCYPIKKILGKFIVVVSGFGCKDGVICDSVIGNRTFDYFKDAEEFLNSPNIDYWVDKRFAW